MPELTSVRVSVSPIEKFREFLATKGMRLTREREIIVNEVFSSHEHFEPDQLVARVTRRDDAQRVSRSTVYRTLSSLEEAGLLRKVARGEHGDVYEHDYGYPQHDHLICQKCGDLIEFHNKAISKLLDEIADEHNFRMSSHRLEVYGTCDNCLRRPRRRHQKLDMV